MAGLVMVVCGTVMMAGCASTGESASREQLTANVGNYSSPPSGVDKPRVGVPAFYVQDTDANFDFGAGTQLEDLAADQLTTLMYKTRRFTMIERAQLNQLLAEQGLEGIVRQGELARMGQVRGVDYLVIGKITAFSVKADRTSQEVGVERGWMSEQIDGITGGVDKSQTRLTTRIGVDIRLVDPETGQIYAPEFTDFRHSYTAESLGIDVGGVGGSGDADFQVQEDDAGLLLRLAFDDTIQKMLPEIDRTVMRRSDSGSAAAGANQNSQSMQPNQSGANQSGSDQDRSSMNFCPYCGEEVAAGAKFCGSCGESLQ